MRAKRRTEIDIGRLQSVAVGDVLLGYHLQMDLRPGLDILKGDDLLEPQTSRFETASDDKPDRPRRECGP